jgi:hypothetical protein
MSDWGDTWKWGNDYSGESQEVLLVAVSLSPSGSLKHSWWAGPVDRDKYEKEISEWAQRVLDIQGGYVHLYPTKGDGSPDLMDFLEDCRKDDG